MATTRKTTPSKLSAATNGTRNVAAAASPAGKHLFELPLDGVTYRFYKKPKAAHVMMLARMGSEAPEKLVGFIEEWLTHNVGAEHADEILGKMYSFESKLDIDAVAEFMSNATEEATGDPTS